MSDATLVLQIYTGCRLLSESTCSRNVFYEFKPLALGGVIFNSGVRDGDVSCSEYFMDPKSAGTCARSKR